MNFILSKATTSLIACLALLILGCGGGSDNAPDQAVRAIQTPDDAAAYFAVVFEMTELYQHPRSKRLLSGEAITAPTRKTISTVQCESGYYTDDDATGRRDYYDCAGTYDSGIATQYSVLNGPITSSIALDDESTLGLSNACDAETGTRYGEPNNPYIEYQRIESDTQLVETLTHQTLSVASTYMADYNNGGPLRFVRLCREFDGLRTNDNLRDEAPAAQFDFDQLVIRSEERESNAGFVEYKVDGALAVNLGELENGCPVGGMAVATITPITQHLQSYVVTDGVIQVTDEAGTVAQIRVVEPSENSTLQITVGAQSTYVRYFNLLQACDGYF
ncbi:hypothetical protein [uncultured Abyssibacter sp.]|uniref:hypothetical protein n=1 Tax=uncultured Abyssibacter sp. TaxID=2320202 RepID=UPI0032B2D358